MSDPRGDSPGGPRLPERLRELHDEVDRGAARLLDLHGGRITCHRGCSGCCVDGLTVFGVEADRIRSRHAFLLREGRPHPPGACAFLDADGGCRIYADRPYVCRTQGLPLRWTEEEYEYRDICPLNDGDADRPRLESLPQEACWTLGPYEGRLRALETARAGSHERTPLRSLFARDP